MTRRPPDYPETLRIPITSALKAQLELEAWECQKKLDEYVRDLLKTRGKWARTVGRAGGYLLQGPANPPKDPRFDRS